MSNRRRLVSTGQAVKVDHPEKRKVEAYNPSVRAHLWVVATVYRVIPEQWHSGDPSVTPLLDHENLMQATPVFCYHCQKPYTTYLATQPCHGDP